MMGENPSSESLYLGFCLGFNESEVRAKIGKEHWVVVFEGRGGGGGGGASKQKKYLLKYHSSN